MNTMPISPIKITHIAGFTLIEMVVVIVIVGTLAVTVLPRFTEQSTFDARGFYDETLSALRYAQKTAVAQRRQVCATFTTTSLSLQIASSFGGACNANLAQANGNVPYKVTARSTITYSAAPAALTFNPDGTVSTGASIQVVGAGSAITVVAGTGYVY